MGYIVIKWTGECAVSFLISYPGEDEYSDRHAHGTTDLSVFSSEKIFFAALQVCIFPIFLSLPSVDSVTQRIKKLVMAVRAAAFSPFFHLLALWCGRLP